MSNQLEMQINSEISKVSLRNLCLIKIVKIATDDEEVEVNDKDMLNKQYVDLDIKHLKSEIKSLVMMTAVNDYEECEKYLGIERLSELVEQQDREEQVQEEDEDEEEEEEEDDE